MNPSTTISPEEQPEIPIKDHGIVINPVDPDIVIDLRLQYEDGEISINEFEKRIDELSWK